MGSTKLVETVIESSWRALGEGNISSGLATGLHVLIGSFSSLSLRPCLCADIGARILKVQMRTWVAGAWVPEVRRKSLRTRKRMIPWIGIRHRYVVSIHPEWMLVSTLTIGYSDMTSGRLWWNEWLE